MGIRAVFGHSQCLKAHWEELKPHRLIRGTDQSLFTEQSNERGEKKVEESSRSCSAVLRFRLRVSLQDFCSRAN